MCPQPGSQSLTRAGPRYIPNPFDPSLPPLSIPPHPFVPSPSSSAPSPPTQADAHYDPAQAEAWESTLRARLAATWQGAWEENPLPEGRNFADLEPLMRLHILYQLCEWRADECPYVRGAMNRTVKTQGYGGDSLREEPIAVDSHGHRYYYFAHDHNSTLLYREVPPEVLQNQQNWHSQNDAEFWTECATLDEMEQFAQHWKKRKHEGEQYLWEYIGEEVYPKLRETAAARARALERQRAYDEAPKKRSSRIATIHVVKEQEEKLRIEREAERKVLREQERARRQARDAERRRLNMEIAATRAKEDAEMKRKHKLLEREKRYLKRERAMLKVQKKRAGTLTGRMPLDWSTWEDGIEDGSIFWRVKRPRKPRGPQGLTTGYYLVSRGQRSCDNGKPLRARKPLTDVQILSSCSKVVEKMIVSVAREFGEEVSYQNPLFPAVVVGAQKPSHKKKSHKKKTLHDPLKALVVAATAPKKSHKKKSHKKKKTEVLGTGQLGVQSPAQAPGFQFLPGRALLQGLPQATALQTAAPQPFSQAMSILPQSAGTPIGMSPVPVQMPASLQEMTALAQMTGAAAPGSLAQLTHGQQAQFVAMMQQAFQQQQASAVFQQALCMAPRSSFVEPQGGPPVAAAPAQMGVARAVQATIPKAEPQPAGFPIGGIPTNSGATRNGPSAPNGT